MKRLFALIMTLMLVVVPSAVGRQKNEVVKKVAPFSVISIVGGINVVYEQGNGYEVRFDGNGAAFVDERVDDSSLNLRIKGGVSKIGGVYYESIDGTDGVTVYVKAPSVDTFNLVGSGSVSVDGMTAKNVVFSVAGSGQIKVKGLSADEATFNVAGSGHLDATGVRAGKAAFSVAGSGSMNANVSQSSDLWCNVSGSGEIVVSGNADKYSKFVYGSGSIFDDSLKYKTKSNNSIRNGNIYYYNNGGGNQRNDNGILANP